MIFQQNTLLAYDMLILLLSGLEPLLDKVKIEWRDTDANFGRLHAGGGLSGNMQEPNFPLGHVDQIGPQRSSEMEEYPTSGYIALKPREPGPYPQ